MPQPPHELTHRWSRRRTLVALGSTGILGAVAGCLDWGLDTDGPGTVGDDSTGSSGSGLDVTTIAQGIEVTATDSAIQAVNLIGPSGDALGHQSIPAGASTVSFQLLSRQGSGYETGGYTVVGVNDGESVAETTVDLNPAVGISAVFRGEERPELDWNRQDSSDWWQYLCGVEVENTGTGPDYIEGVKVEKPPNSPFYDQAISFSGGIFIPPGQTGVVNQERNPIFKPPQGTSCRHDTPTTEETVLTVNSTVGDNPTWSQKYRYTQRDDTAYCNYAPVDE